MDEAPDVLPCVDKLAFDSQREAEVAAIVAQYQHGAQLKVYRCRNCGLWHLSSGSSMNVDD